MPGHVSLETLTLEEHDGKTTLTATSVFDSVEDRDGTLESGMESGAAETYDRLDEYLEGLQGARCRLTNAPTRTGDERPRSRRFRAALGATNCHRSQFVDGHEAIPESLSNATAERPRMASRQAGAGLRSRARRAIALIRLR